MTLSHCIRCLTAHWTRCGKGLGGRYLIPIYSISHYPKHSLQNWHSMCVSLQQKSMTVRVQWKYLINYNGAMGWKRFVWWTGFLGFLWCKEVPGKASGFASMYKNFNLRLTWLKKVLILHCNGKYGGKHENSNSRWTSSIYTGINSIHFHVFSYYPHTFKTWSVFFMPDLS